MALSKIKSTSLETDATNLVLIKTITLTTATAGISFKDSDSDVTFDNTYNTYKFIGNVKQATDDRVIYVRCSNDGTNFDTVSGRHLGDKILRNNGSLDGSSDQTSTVWVFDNKAGGTAAGENYAFEITIYNSDLHYPRYLGLMQNARFTDNTGVISIISGRYNYDGKIKGLNFFPNSSSNFIADSTISMYGVKS